MRMTHVGATVGIFCVAVMWGATVGAQSDSESVTRAVTKLLDDYHKAGRFNGSALVSRSGAVVFRGGRGFADAKKRIPNTSTTRFRIASMTKPFTAALVMRLVDQGKLDLTASVIRYLPEYTGRLDGAITIHHLLRHTSGLPRIVTRPDIAELKQPKPLGEVISKYCLQKPTAAPGKRFLYTNAGYLILARVIEKVTGTSYAQAMRDLLDAGKLRATGCGGSNDRAGNIAVGHSRNGKAIGADLPVAWQNTVGSGILVSTVEDLHRWDRLLDTDELLSSASRRKMFEPGDSGYGYGWLVGRIAPDQWPAFLQRFQVPAGKPRDGAIRIAMHPGDLNGFRGMMTRVPDHRHAIILLDNMDHRTLAEITIKILGILHPERPDRPTKDRRPGSPMAW